MNISRLSNVAANAQPASVRPFQSQTKASEAPERGDSNPHNTHSVSGRSGGRVEDHGHDHSQRVANFASQIETRVQNAIENGNMSDEQVQGLQQAAAQFQALMNRIGNADFAAAPQRQVLYALHQLTAQIQKILHPDDQDRPGATNAFQKGSDAASAPIAPTIDAVA